MIGVSSFRTGLVVSALFLASCGGGGDSPAPPTAPSNLSYPAPPTFTKGVTIATLNPTVGGSPASYSVSPTLPAGLSFNTTSGAISGTPTELQLTKNYVVYATNASGNASTSLDITVNDVAPTLVYSQPNHSLTVSHPITAIVPTSGGGPVLTWRVDRALPEGLTFSTTTGQITGIPMSAELPSNYVVTAQNSGGSANFSLNIRVGLNTGPQPGVLVDLGHVTGVAETAFVGNRILSVDQYGRVLVHDAQTGARAVTVESNCSGPCGSYMRAQLAGNTLVTRSNSRYDVFSVVDATLLAQISSPPPSTLPGGDFKTWRLATDGSYLAEISTNGLKVWSTTGTLLVTRTGNYRDALLFCKPGELRVAGGSANAQLVEFISLPAGTSTFSSPYIGAVTAWFDDGERFLARANNDLLVYSKTGSNLGTVALTGGAASPYYTFGGSGNFYWFWYLSDTSVRIYAVGGGNTPVATLTGSLQPQQSPGLIMLSGDQPQVQIVDLTGATPATTTFTTVNRTTSIAARSTTDWVYGDGSGVLRGAPQSTLPARFTYGAVSDIAGSGTRVAIGTASGQILLFNSARVQEGTIQFYSAPYMSMALSSDGSLLTSLGDPNTVPRPLDPTVLRQFSVPSGAIVQDWPQPPTGTGPTLYNFQVSSNGGVLGRATRGSNSAVTRTVIRVDGTPLWSDMITSDDSEVSLRLSPSGAGIAAPSEFNWRYFTRTNLYTNGVLTGNVAGAPVGWLDDGRLLINQYYRGGGLGANLFEFARIYDPNGQALATPPLPEIKRFQVLDANTIYSPEKNIILNVNTGATTWSSQTEASLERGAVTGNFVVFPSGPTVRAEPR